ncbi:MAG TPA: DUF3127 domain-containing protein [Longimicrobiales bacterium]|nr:DUF3127 domain-containing protein [Longimicrobiales bacterium]
MDLQLTGKVTQVLEEQAGEGRNGPWRKQEFILETEGQYPKPVCIVQWGENIESFGIEEGETITAHIDIQSREYNGRWYTDVKAWKVERPQAAGQKGPGGPQAHRGGPTPPEPGVEDPDDDLPF